MDEKQRQQIQSLIDYFKNNFLHSDNSLRKEKEQLLIDIKLVCAENENPDFAEFLKQIDELKNLPNKKP